MTNGRLLVGAFRGAIGIGAVISATAAALALAGLVWPALDAATDLAQLFALYAAGLMALAGVFRAGRLILLFTAFGLVALLFLLLPDALAGLSPNAKSSLSAQQLTVLTANLWSENRQLDKLGLLIADEKPDVVVLEEVVGFSREQLAQLAIGYKIAAAPTGSPYSDIAILTKLDLFEAAPRVAGDLAEVRLWHPHLLGGAPFEVIGVHATHRPNQGAAASDLLKLAQDIGPLSDRALLVGDFNAVPWSRALIKFDSSVEVLRRTHAIGTWPAPSRRFSRFHLCIPAFAPIDHVYAGRAWRLIEAHRGRDIGSDHFPVIARLVRSIG